MEEQKLDEAIATLVGMASALPEDASDEEIKSIMEAVPEHAEMLRVFTDPRVRKAGLEFMKMVNVYFQNLLRAHEEGRKVGICSFNFPPEIFYAMDIIPLPLEILTSFASTLWKGGAEPYIDYCTEIGIPDTMCSAQKGSTGAVLKGLTTKPDLALTAAPGSCDANSKIFEFVAEYIGIPYVALDSPPRYDERGIKYYRKEFRRLISNLEKITGHKLNPDKLREIAENTKKSDEYILELYDMRKAVPNPVPGIFNVFITGTKFTAAGTPEAVRVLKACYETSKDRMKRGEGPLPEEKVRAIWIYTGYYFPSMGLWTWMEDNGISYLIDMLSSFATRDYEIDTSTTDSIIDCLADESFNYPMTRGMRGPYDARANWLEDTISACKDFKPDCGIFCGHMACKNAWGAFRVLRDKIKEILGIPILRLEADAWDERITPLSVVKEKIEEFIATVVL